jgi:hypothetical protein
MKSLNNFATKHLAGALRDQSGAQQTPECRQDGCQKANSQFALVSVSDHDFSFMKELGFQVAAVSPT